MHMLSLQSIELLSLEVAQKHPSVQTITPAKNDNQIRVALINVKEKEHNAMKLSGDKRDLMQTASQKWIKVASDVSNARFPVHY